MIFIVWQFYVKHLITASNQKYVIRFYFPQLVNKQLDHSGKVVQ